MKSKYINKNIIGSDETGVGDYFTPLVSASVFLTYEQALQLEKLGIRDSKTLTSKQISFFAFKITELKQHAIHHLTTSGYNKLSKFFNAHELKTLLHLNTVKKLIDKFNQDLIIIDKYVEPKKWYEYEEKLNSSMLEIPKIKDEIYFITKGEQEHIAVAAASIVARNFLLYKMEYKNKDWKTVFPLGAGENVIQFGKKFVQQHGKDKLFNVAKISFKTTQKIADN